MHNNIFSINYCQIFYIKNMSDTFICRTKAASALKKYLDINLDISIEYLDI